MILHDVLGIFELKKRATRSVYERADLRFVWNHAACKIFAEAQMWEWMVPLIQAHVEVAEGCSISGRQFRLFHVSRTSWQRSGTRFSMRGIDEVIFIPFLAV